jgi:hypothetical protein
MPFVDFDRDVFFFFFFFSSSLVACMCFFPFLLDESELLPYSCVVGVLGFLFYLFSSVLEKESILMRVSLRCESTARKKKTKQNHIICT